MSGQRLKSCAAGTMLAIAALAGGCAGKGSGDPGASSLPLGENCQSIRSKLDRLLNNGVQSKVEALSAGRALSPAARSDAESYNRLLNQYLGARCHVV